MYTLQKKINLNLYSHAVIIDVILSLTPEELRILYDVQNKFWKERLENLASPEAYEQAMKVDIVNCSNDDREKNLINIAGHFERICSSPEENHSAHSMKVLDTWDSRPLLSEVCGVCVKWKNAWYQNMAQKIINSDDRKNLKRVKKLILYMSYVSRRWGIMELDFLFLGEKGVQESLFQWLLIVITSALFWLKDPNKNYMAKYHIMSDYEKMVFIGLSGIQAGEDVDKIEKELLKILEK
jgi:hypothetical protein